VTDARIRAIVREEIEAASKPLVSRKDLPFEVNAIRRLEAEGRLTPVCIGRQKFYRWQDVLALAAVS
jgi:hypothetical protein